MKADRLRPPNLLDDRVLQLPWGIGISKSREVAYAAEGEGGDPPYLARYHIKSRHVIFGQKCHDRGKAHAPTSTQEMRFVAVFKT